MNKRKLPIGRTELPRTWFPALAVCSVCFVLGVVSGTLLSSEFAKGDAAAGFVSDYAASVMSGAVDGGFFSVFLSVGWYHILAFLLGFSMLGAALVPLLAGARGFTLSFALATLVRLYSAAGAVAGMALVGLSALLSVPLFFMLAVDAMCASCELIGIGLLRQPPAGPGVNTAEHLIRFLAAVILLLLISAGERALIGSDLLKFPVFS